MPSEPVQGVVFGCLFTFLPPIKASQLQPIDDIPKPMPYALITQLSLTWSLEKKCSIGSGLVCLKFMVAALVVIREGKALTFVVVQS